MNVTSVKDWIVANLYTYTSGTKTNLFNVETSKNKKDFQPLNQLVIN